MSPAEQLLNEIAGTTGTPDLPPEDDQNCPVRADGTHCVHWWDAEGPCCGCGAGGETVMIGDQWYWIDRHLDGAEIGPYPDQAQARMALAADERRRALADALGDL